MTADIPRIPFEILDRTLAHNPYIPELPFQRQIEFLELECQDALFGGAGSGGKSSALLMAALMFAQVPGYSALIVRRNFTDLKLPGGLIDRSIDWLNKKPGAKWNAQENRWRFREGSTLQFGYADKEGDEQRYHGAEFQFIGIDEACQFTEKQLKFFFERLRRKVEITAPLRMRLATTPGGVGHQYIYKRYVNPGSPGKAFIPATIHDNAAVDKDQYILSLAELDPIRRRQMLDGDWEAVEGGLIKREWFGWWRPVPELPGTAVLTNNTGIELERFRLDHCARFQTCDPAASTSAISDYFVLSTWAVTPKANVVWIGCHRGKYEIADQVGVCQRLYRRYQPQFLAVEEVLNQRALAQLLRRSTQPVMAIRAVSPQGRDKLNRAAGFIALAASGRVFVPERSHPQDFDTEEVLGEVVRFTGEDKRSAHDDVVDTCSYMHQMLPFIRNHLGGASHKPFIFHESKSGPFSGLT